MAASLRCLVLNASLEPISVVSAQRGLVLLLKERAMMLERAQVCVRASGHVRSHCGMALCCQSNGVKVACVAMREYARRSLLSCAAWRRLPICMRMVVAPGMEIRRGRSSSKASVTSGRFPRSSCKYPSACCPCCQRGRVSALVCML